jgi:hypothetical protein
VTSPLDRHVVSVCFKNGARQKLFCADHAEALRVWNAIVDSMTAGSPFSVVEDASSATLIVLAEVCSVSFGVPVEFLKTAPPMPREQVFDDVVMAHLDA